MRDEQRINRFIFDEFLEYMLRHLEVSELRKISSLKSLMARLRRSPGDRSNQSLPAISRIRSRYRTRRHGRFKLIVRVTFALASRCSMLSEPQIFSAR